MNLFSRILNIGKRLIIIGSSPIIRILETLFFGLENKAAPQPVFIVGAPRTGSTIFYQALTNRFNIAYIDNFTCTWHRNLRFGMWLSNRLYGDMPHNNFRAEHGSTREFGGHAPSECGEFWYRWLPTDRHFVDHTEITSEIVRAVRVEVLGASALLRRPMLFKNLSSGQRLRLISKAFPNAKIIFVRRDPRFVVRSILKARKKLGIGNDQWWSIMPRNVNELLSLPEPEMCVAQVYYLEKQIEEDLKLFPKKNVKEVHYQELDAKLVEKLGDWIELTRKPGGEVPEFGKDNIENMSEEELHALNRLVKSHPFKRELFI